MTDLELIKLMKRYKHLEFKYHRYLDKLAWADDPDATAEYKNATMEKWYQEVYSKENKE
mgnify:CR=1 FL=1